MQREFTIATFYAFTPVSASLRLTLKEGLEKIAKEQGLLGLFILSDEGFNTTLAGPQGAIDEAVAFVRVETAAVFDVKLSLSNKTPFHRFRIAERDEIVTLGQDVSIEDVSRARAYLAPQEWDAKLKAGATVIDTRNWYETKIGKFKTAIDPQLEEFSEWPEYLKKADLDKEQEVLIYCTGGIRCEKAAVEMKRQGFKKVFQLEGGILNYLAQYPEQEFDGECFVFDHRVAVDQKLQPSKNYSLCPHCGQPAQITIECVRCDTPSMVCDKCHAEEFGQTCSKNCAHHHRVRPGSKGARQKPFFEQ